MDWEYEEMTPGKHVLSGVVHNSVNDLFAEGKSFKTTFIKHRTDYPDHALFKSVGGLYFICYFDREKKRGSPHEKAPSG